MKTIGIISVPEIKLTIGRIIVRPIVIKENFMGNNKYVVAEVSYTAEDIMRFGERKLRKITNRAKRHLESRGAENVLFAQNVRNVLKKRDLYEAYAPKRISKIPPCRVVECFLKALETYDFCNKKVVEKVVVYDKEMRGVDFESLLKICMKVKEVILFTDNTEKAEIPAQKLFEEYGVLINVKENRLAQGVNLPQIMIDVDKGRIRIKDFVVDGAEFVSNSGIYDLDPQEEAECLGDECDLLIRNLMSGKIVL